MVSPVLTRCLRMQVSVTAVTDLTLALPNRYRPRRLAVQIGMRAAPPSVTPRQIPARMTRQCGGDEIEAGCPKRLASAKPRQRHPPAGPQAEAADRLIGIYGAGGQMPAFKSDEGGKGEAVGADQGLRGQARGEG